jgi:hypothetical protein
MILLLIGQYIIENCAKSKVEKRMLISALY